MPVLGTKLHPPRPRRRLVQRARLTERLLPDGGEWPRLVLVAAIQVVEPGAGVDAVAMLEAGANATTTSSMRRPSTRR
jgi:hypothetical protein